MIDLTTISLLAAAALGDPTGLKGPETTLPTTSPPVTAARLALIENAGQWASPALYYGRLGDVEVQLFPGRLEFHLQRPGSPEKVAVRIQLEGGRPDCLPRGERLRPETRSFFGGSGDERWEAHPRSFASALYEDLMPGLDLRLREGPASLEWDLLLDPGVTSDGLVLRCDGVEDLAVNEEGLLVLETSIGSIKLGLPTSWTVAEDGATQPVDASYVRLDEQRFGFTVCDRDEDLALVIDPELDWLSYFGGTDLDVGLDTRVGPNGNVYVSGLTSSPDFPTQPGAFQPLGGGVTEGFISVFDPTGSALIHATYLSGSGNDAVRGLDFTATGEVVVCGNTGSSDLPVTPGAAQSVKGAFADGFVARLSADLSTLEYCSYLGDAGAGRSDWCTDIEVDSSGMWSVCGNTRSSDFPVTPGAFQTVFGGETDLFVAKIDPAGNGAADIVWASYLGGSRDESINNATLGTPNAVASPRLVTSDNGEVTLSGVTRSMNFPTTPGALKEASIIGINRDAIVARFEPDGSALVYSTLLGGDDNEISTGVALDASGRAVVIGLTMSVDHPVTADAFQPDHAFPGEDDGWLAVVENDGGALHYGTFLGGARVDAPLELAVEPTGEIFVAGYTNSPFFPITPTAFQTTLLSTGATSDGFLMRLNVTADGPAQLLYSTFMGGSEGDDIWGLELVGPGQVVFSGSTLSDDLPVTAGAFDLTSNPGVVDGHVGRLDARTPGVSFCGPGVANSTGNPGRMSASGSVVAAENELTLHASSLPQAAFGFFLVSQTQGFVAGPGGSEGNLCLASPIGRYVGAGQTQQVDVLGNMSLTLDLTQTPTPTGFVAIQAGQTWNFQAWHRDSVGGMATSNFTDGLSISFL